MIRPSTRQSRSRWNMFSSRPTFLISTLSLSVERFLSALESSSCYGSSEICQNRVPFPYVRLSSSISGLCTYAFATVEAALGIVDALSKAVSTIIFTVRRAVVSSECIATEDSGQWLDIATIEIDGHVRENASTRVSLLYQLCQMVLHTEVR